MSYVSKHPVSELWPAQTPDVLQLYSFPTPNGIKVSAMLEETGLAYEPHLVRLDQTETPQFLALNPNNKIPAIIDPDGPGGQPVALFESGAILIYLAEKTGQFLPADPVERARALQWLMWQMSGVGPMFGQVGFFFRLGGRDYEDKRPLERYLEEAMRLLEVLDGHLEGRDWMVGGAYSIADIAIWPWIRAMLEFYDAADEVELHDCKNVMRWYENALARPASQRALRIPDPEG